MPAVSSASFPVTDAFTGLGVPNRAEALRRPLETFFIDEVSIYATKRVIFTGDLQGNRTPRGGSYE
jgi:hypothetical protein